MFLQGKRRKWYLNLKLRFPFPLFFGGGGNTYYNYRVAVVWQGMPLVFMLEFVISPLFLGSGFTRIHLITDGLTSFKMFWVTNLIWEFCINEECTRPSVQMSPPMTPWLGVSNPQLLGLTCLKKMENVRGIIIYSKSHINYYHLMNILNLLLKVEVCKAWLFSLSLCREINDFYGCWDVRQAFAKTTVECFELFEY